jgi:hypothetical protein
MKTIKLSRTRDLEKGSQKPTSLNEINGYVTEKSITYLT